MFFICGMIQYKRIQCVIMKGTVCKWTIRSRIAQPMARWRRRIAGTPGRNKKF
jgi:hypothetical protein